MQLARLSALILIGLCLGTAEAGKKKAQALPIVSPEPKKDQTLVVPPAPPAAEPGKPGSAFAELHYQIPTARG